MSVTHEVVNKAVVLTVRGVSTPSDVTAAFDAALADTSLDAPNGVLIDTRQAIERLALSVPRRARSPGLPQLIRGGVSWARRIPKVGEGASAE